MKKYLLIISAVVLGAASVSAQENKVNRIPEKGHDVNQEQYTDYDRGFWIAAEALGGYSAHLEGHNMGVAEIDVTAGYRFNEFLKVGAGLGARYYIDQKNLRRHSSNWGMPIYLSARGNMMYGKYRKVVPWWGFDLGGSVRDGFMMRPTVGIRIGEPRQAFTLGFSYMGQNIGCWKIEEGGTVKADKFTSFFCLRLGYEF